MKQRQAICDYVMVLTSAMGLKYQMILTVEGGEREGDETVSV